MFLTHNGIRGKIAAALVIFAAAGPALLPIVARAEDAMAAAGSQDNALQNGSDMASRVKQALHSNQALLDKHINVSMDKGKVVLSGFVVSAGDLQKALRVANETAGDQNVVNQLTIKEGGGGGAG